MKTYWVTYRTIEGFDITEVIEAVDMDQAHYRFNRWAEANLSKRQQENLYIDSITETH